MSEHFDYFKEHPAAQGSTRPVSYKYGYLLGIIKGVMFMNNKQDIKNALMAALDYLEKETDNDK
jgi:hypothetical protein